MSVNSVELENTFNHVSISNFQFSYNHVLFVSLTSSSRTRANSSAQKEVANKVLAGVNPFPSTASTTLDTKSLLEMAPGNAFLTILSKSSLPAGYTTDAARSAAVSTPARMLRRVMLGRAAGLEAIWKAEAVERRQKEARENFMVANY